MCTTIFLEKSINLDFKAIPVWKPSFDGKFSTKSTRQLVRNYKVPEPCFDTFWNNCISPTISIFWWKLVQNWIPVETKMQRFGISLASKCQCCKHLETIDHVILHNKEVHKAWKWFSNHFVVPCLPSHSVVARYNAWLYSTDLVKKGHIRTIIPMLIAWYSWLSRNEAKYNNKKITAFGIITLVMKQL